MQSLINASPILTEYHNDNLKEHKKFLQILLSEEKSQERLREIYKKTPKKKKKKKKAIRAKIKPRKKGRQRRSFDYQTARHIAQSEGISSIAQYRAWYKLNNPARMPKYPESAYRKEWTGWGDFLGVYNTYTRRPGDKTNGKGKYRSFEDARSFARSLNLKSFKDWMQYTKTGQCPMDIPHRPDMVYNKGKRKVYWLSWKDFLGYGIHNTESKIAQVTPVLYIAKKVGVPVNVYVINVIPGGKAALVDHLNKINMRLIAAFYVNSQFDYRSYIRSLPEYHYGEIDEYAINNIFEIIEHLETYLEKVS